MSLSVRPFIWLDDTLAEALETYAAIFPDFEVTYRRNWPDDMPGKGGTLMTAIFRVADQEVMALNGGPHYQLTAAFSLFVACETQAEIDHLWEKLSEGGTIYQCGWLSDRFGVTWQIVPKGLLSLLDDPDRVKAGRATAAMLSMVKLDIAALERAHRGE